jgi:hypothetical protein
VDYGFACVEEAVFSQDYHHSPKPHYSVSPWTILT